MNFTIVQSRLMLWILLGFALVCSQCSADMSTSRSSSVDEQCSVGQDCSTTGNSVHYENVQRQQEKEEKPSDKYKKPMSEVSNLEADDEEEDEPSDFYTDLLGHNMETLEKFMEAVEKSRAQVLRKMRRVMNQMALSRESMMEKLDALLDSVSRSRVMKEIDHLLDEVSNSQVMKEIKALPKEEVLSTSQVETKEIRESFLLGVRNRSYIAAGIMVAITTAVLVAGSLYYAWCHHDVGTYVLVNEDHPSEGDSHVAVTNGLNGTEQNKHLDSNEAVSSSKEIKTDTSTGASDGEQSNGAAVKSGDDHGDEPINGSLVDKDGVPNGTPTTNNIASNSASIGSVAATDKGKDALNGGSKVNTNGEVVGVNGTSHEKADDGHLEKSVVEPVQKVQAETSKVEEEAKIKIPHRATHGGDL